MVAKLVDLFDEKRQAALRARLDRAMTLSDVADALYDELTFYSDVDGSYVNSMTRSQASVALALLSLVRDSNEQMGRITNWKSDQRKECGGASERRDQRLAHGSADNVFRGACVTVSAAVGASAGFWLGPGGAVFGATVAVSGMSLALVLL